MPINEVINWLKETGFIEHVDGTIRVWFDKNQNTWIVSDGKRELAISETKAREILLESLNS